MTIESRIKQLESKPPKTESTDGKERLLQHLAQIAERTGPPSPEQQVEAQEWVEAEWPAVIERTKHNAV